MKLLIFWLYQLVMYGVALSYVPQIVRLYKTKDANELSFITFLGFALLQVISAIHGYYTHNLTLLFSMILCVVFSLILNVQIICYRFFR